MSGNKSFARSMNGINNIEINEVQFPDGSTITSASNLVQLDTTNDFTSNNSFNSNLPTSTKEHTVGELTDFMILNKQSADLLYTGTDTNDYITGFSRNGTTGVITLSQADTGTPITSETITTITDTQLTAIGNAVLKTTDQDIDGEKTFVDFPKIKLTDDVPPAVPDPTADNQFATKKYVDDNGGGSTPSNMATTDTAQTISGLKSFSNQRPKAVSTATNTTATSQELITKSDGDSFYAPKNPTTMVKQELNVYLYTVSAGNPADTNPNQYGGAIASRLTCYVSTFNGSYSAVSLDFSVVGEWANVEYDKGVVIARAVYVDAIPSGNYAYDKILRAPIQGTATSFIQNFNVSYYAVDRNSTMESCNGKFIDYDIEDDKLYSYTVVLVNSDTNNTGVRFWLNRTVNSATLPPYERGTSCITALLYN